MVIFSKFYMLMGKKTTQPATLKDMCYTF